MPLDIVGGSVPYDKSNFEDDIYFRASRALGTNNVIYQYKIFDGKAYFLAVPSRALVKAPLGFCPLVEALPGGDLFEDKNKIYFYEKDDVAGVISWNKLNGTMEVYAGKSKIIVPKIKLLQKPIKSIKSNEVSPHDWRNKKLSEQAYFQNIGNMIVGTALVALVMIFITGIFLNIKYLFDQEALMIQSKKSQASSVKLLKEVNAFNGQSPTFYFIEYKDLKNRIGQVDGTLLEYNVDGTSRYFKAIVPNDFNKETLSTIDFEKTALNDHEVMISGWLGEDK
tara:strand:+ start:222 stop:1064 length:843 start_codon:yes stop_codon:yes gene_type:complete